LIRAIILCCAIVMIPAASALSWCVWHFWQIDNVSRVRAAELEQSIRDRLLIGSSHDDVIDWITREETIDVQNQLGNRIEAWVLNVTPMRDLRILFFFDSSGNLARVKVAAEGRFESGNHDWNGCRMTPSKAG